MKVKSILVSQPMPSAPYLEIAKKEGVSIDFKPFIEIQGLDAKDLRSQKIDLIHYNGVIMTSRLAVDHYFRLAEEMRFSVPENMRYVCTSEAIANYLQKYVVYRKRKISFGEKGLKDLLPIFKKHAAENYILPSSDVLSEDIQTALNSAKIKWTRAVMYRTAAADISAIDLDQYDMLVFFSPQGVKSLFSNFENFKQGNKKIAAFGATTQHAAEEAGLIVDLPVPTKESPSMTMALEKFLHKVNR